MINDPIISLQMQVDELKSREVIHKQTIDDLQRRCDSALGHIRKFDQVVRNIGSYVGATCGGIDVPHANGKGSDTEQAIILKIEELITRKDVEPAPLDYWHKKDCEYLEQMQVDELKSREVCLTKENEELRNANLYLNGRLREAIKVINPLKSQASEPSVCHMCNAIRKQTLEEAAARVKDMQGGKSTYADEELRRMAKEE